MQRQANIIPKTTKIYEELGNYPETLESKTNAGLEN